MRQKRSKNYRKQMAIYSRNFQFRQPFQVLGKIDAIRAREDVSGQGVLIYMNIVDGDIVYDATKYKMNLPKALEGVVQGTIKPSMYSRQSYSYIESICLLITKF